MFKNSLFPKANTDICYTITDCYLGKILIACKGVYIYAIFLGDTEEDVLYQFCGQINYSTKNSVSIDVKKILQYIEDPINNQEILSEFHYLDIYEQTTPFQRKVWRYLQDIPVGTTISYSELAKKMDVPKSARAIAKACAANPIAILIPCHRVIKNDGSLSGYRWGIERKRALLKKEGVVI